MPADNVKRAIDKATGGAAAEQYEEIVYEGYGPGGVAILVEAATDNRNRTAADVRSVFAKAGGQLAGSGAVAWQFEPRGVVTIPRDGKDPDEVALAAIDAGAEDVDTEADPIEVMTDPGRPRSRAQGHRIRRLQGRIRGSDDVTQAEVELDVQQRARTSASSRSSKTSTTSSA